MNETELLNAVQDRLKDHQPSEYAIEMSRQGARNEGHWWYVVVHPSREDVRASDYTRILEQVEDEIAQRHGVKVLLVPTIED